MLKILTTTAATAALLIGGVVAADAASTPTTPAPSWTTRPCATEDSVNCVWDAQTRGDGSGHSFIVRQVPGRARMVCVFFTEARHARHHDYCTTTR